LICAVRLASVSASLGLLSYAMSWKFTRKPAATQLSRKASIAAYQPAVGADVEAYGDVRVIPSKEQATL